MKSIWNPYEIHMKSIWNPYDICIICRFLLFHRRRSGEDSEEEDQGRHPAPSGDDWDAHSIQVIEYFLDKWWIKGLTMVNWIFRNSCWVLLCWFFSPCFFSVDVWEASWLQMDPIILICALGWWFSHVSLVPGAKDTKRSQRTTRRVVIHLRSQLNDPLNWPIGTSRGE